MIIVIIIIIIYHYLFIPFFNMESLISLKIVYPVAAPNGCHGVTALTNRMLRLHQNFMVSGRQESV